MADRLDVAPARVDLDLIVGGRSNVTWRVDLEGRPVQVLRHPPLGNTVAGGHDVVREARVLQAMWSSDVPVPHVVDIVTNSPVGAPVVVMDFVPGEVLRGPRDVERVVPVGDRDALVRDLVDILARIHGASTEAIPIRTSSRSIADRQLARWLEQSRREGCDELALIESAHAVLAGQAPTSTEATLVHGDYRLENCLVRSDGTRILAVLDWELATIGDPLADVGLLLAYWAQLGDAVRALHDAPTLVDGMPPRDQIVDWYLAQTGRDEHALCYYEALGWWKLACIVGGVHARIRRGVFAPPDRTEDSYAAQARALAEEALARARGISRV